MSTNGQPITVLKRGARQGGSRPVRSVGRASADFKGINRRRGDLTRAGEITEAEIPKSKIQIPNKNQSPHSKQKRVCKKETARRRHAKSTCLRHPNLLNSKSQRPKSKYNPNSKTHIPNKTQSANSNHQNREMDVNNRRHAKSTCLRHPNLLNSKSQRPKSK